MQLPPDTLDAIEAQAWAMLVAGTRSHRAPFHSGMVATTGADGPALRTVILRGADAEAHRLRFHTDTRSPKFAELTADPRLAWAFYDEPSRLQLRLRGQAVVHHDDAVADAQWQATPLNSRRIYHAVVAPGSVSEAATSGLPPALDDGRWTLEYSERARPNFAVVETFVTHLEALFLHHAGHRRAAFRYAADGRREDARWLVP